MKIKSLEIENFKLFDRKFDEIKDVSKADLILLNGPNGYGKTTIFDALELALTGEIKRIKNYNISLGVGRTEKYLRKILLTDPSQNAYVVLTLQEGEHEIKLGRFYEKSSDNEDEASIDNNPHKIFEKFERKLFVNGREIVPEEEQITILKQYHLYNIEEFFDKCCFLSQDEHLQFLKEAKKDKSTALDFLFRLPEEQIRELNRINNIILSLKNKNTKNYLGYITRFKKTEEELSNKIKELEEKADKIQASHRIEETVEYLCLFPEKGFKWDKKNAVLNDDEFSSANREINKLIYYAEQKKACCNYIWNQPFRDLIKPFFGGEDIRYEDHALEYSYRYFPLVQNIEMLEAKYHKQQRLEKLRVNLEKREIYKIDWGIMSGEELLDEEEIESVKNEIKQLEKLEKIQGTADKVISSIIETRKILLRQTGEAIEQDMIDKRECPYCGAPYDERKSLEDNILKEERKLLSLSEGIAGEVQNKIDEIYEKYLNDVAEAIELRLQDIVSERIYKKCQEVKKYKGQLREISSLLQGIEVSLPEVFQEDVTEISRGYEKLISNLEQKLKKIPQEVEEQLTAKEFLKDYDKYYDNKQEKFDAMELSPLLKKQEYLRKVFYDSDRDLIRKKKEELDIVKNRCKKLEEIYNKLIKYKKAIEEGITDYKKSVLQKIEPLLHVYTAKILQQKFCGRSIFILTDKDIKNFQLIHSAEDNHDILYNMSSGQLAAVSLSFLLCMHRVYAQQQSLPILLIDDPVQTIDDVNMVGLVDILRFEFQDAQIIISTHEQKFEWYLKYKYEKAEKKIESFNMKNIVLQRG